MVFWEGISNESLLEALAPSISSFGPESILKRSAGNTAKPGGGLNDAGSGAVLLAVPVSSAPLAAAASSLNVA
eukprot:13878206-Heterocapsa_arctica.AAC.1